MYNESIYRHIHLRARETLPRFLLACVFNIIPKNWLANKEAVLVTLLFVNGHRTTRA